MSPDPIIAVEDALQQAWDTYTVEPEIMWIPGSVLLKLPTDSLRLSLKKTRGGLRRNILRELRKRSRAT